jgi:hypothetical protein
MNSSNLLGISLEASIMLGIVCRSWVLLFLWMPR